MDFDLNNLKLHHYFGGDRKVLFHSEPGYRCYLIDLGNGEALVEEEWDGLEELFESNSSMRNSFSNTSRHGDMVQIASVPLWLQRKWEEDCRGDPECIRRKLNDPDYAKFRTNGWSI